MSKLPSRGRVHAHRVIFLVLITVLAGCEDRESPTVTFRIDCERISAGSGVAIAPHSDNLLMVMGADESALVGTGSFAWVFDAAATEIESESSIIELNLLPDEENPLRLRMSLRNNYPVKVELANTCTELRDAMTGEQYSYNHVFAPGKYNLIIVRADTTGEATSN